MRPVIRLLGSRIAYYLMVVHTSPRSSTNMTMMICWHSKWDTPSESVLERVVVFCWLIHSLIRFCPRWSLFWFRSAVKETPEAKKAIQESDLVGSHHMCFILWGKNAAAKLDSDKKKSDPEEESEEVFPNRPFWYLKAKTNLKFFFKM